MGMILVRYGEVALKGGNCSLFTRQLRRNIRDALKRHGIAGVVLEEGRRLYVETDEVEAALEPLSRVFGVVSLSPVAVVEPSIEAMQAEALRMAKRFGLSPAHTFRVASRRADKRFPFISPEIDRLVGGVVQDAAGAEVDLRGPADLTIGVEVQAGRALMYGETTPGPGGLPLPTAGRAIALMSGGIDSPVAAWMLMKRGCGVIPLHFSQNPTETEKALDNCRVLERYAYGWRIDPIVIPQEEILGPTAAKLRRLGAGRWTCIFCKRAMLLKAAEIAERLHAHAIVIGDSLGQVASQTLPNLEIVSYGVPKPILRPLIGMDKVEITKLARQIGTFDVSTRSAAPCAYLPARPITQGDLQEFLGLLEQLNALE